MIVLTLFVKVFRYNVYLEKLFHFKFKRNLNALCKTFNLCFFVKIFLTFSVIFNIQGCIIYSFFMILKLEDSFPFLIDFSFLFFYILVKLSSFYVITNNTCVIFNCCVIQIYIYFMLNCGKNYLKKL